MGDQLLAFTAVESLAIRLAVPHDAPDIVSLRLQLEGWLASRGVEQWRHGEVALADVVREISDGDWHVASEGKSLLGALRLLWSDAPVWQHDNEFAAYVHGLMVPRSNAGEGIGAALLSWAEQQAKSRDARTLRLDCVETNARLRAYYSALGFREVGQRDFDGPWYSATLFEKALRDGR